VPFDLAHFVTLDRYDAMDRAGAEVSHFLAQVGDAQYDAWRADVHAQFVDDATGVGGYVTALGARVHQQHHVGDVEVGLLYMPEFAPEHVSAALHAGLALPTTISDTSVVAEGIDSRIADTALAIPRGTTARLGGSLLWQDDALFARGDLALDANLEAAGGRVDPFGRAGAGFGIIAGSAALMAEAEVLVGGPVTSVAGTGALSVRLDAGPLQVYGAYVFGLDSTTRTDMSGAFVLGTDVPL
jgi:hypothetical protein